MMTLLPKMRPPRKKGASRAFFCREESRTMWRGKRRPAGHEKAFSHKHPGCGTGELPSAGWNWRGRREPAPDRPGREVLLSLFSLCDIPNLGNQRVMVFRTDRYVAGAVWRQRRDGSGSLPNRYTMHVRVNAGCRKQRRPRSFRPQPGFEYHLCLKEDLKYGTLNR